MGGVAFWEPSRHALIVAGIVVGVLLASAAIAWRDAWLGPVGRNRKWLLRGLLGGILVVGLLVAIAHRHDLEDTLKRVEHGDPAWLALGIAFETLSFTGYMILTHEVYSPRLPRINWPASVELTLAGVVATRVLSAGGAGGIAFTAWALNRAGMGARLAARYLAAFLALLYSWYIGVLLVGGLIVATGVAHAVPNALGIVALAVGGLATLAMVLILRIPDDLERRTARIAEGGGWLSGLAKRLATVPEIAGNATRLAVGIARERPIVMVGPLLWWAADIATLWACFKAFGSAPAAGTLVLCYFLGQLGNLLPLPGGVGGTEGGMVGAFAASGIDAGLALLAVIAYQLISTYLPAIPGLAAYASLHRRMRSWGPASEQEAEPVPAARA